MGMIGSNLSLNYAKNNLLRTELHLLGIVHLLRIIRFVANPNFEHAILQEYPWGRRGLSVDGGGGGQIC